VPCLSPSRSGGRRVKGGPTPGESTPPAPLAGWLFRVAYVSQRGETYSKLYRQQAAAERFARKVLDNGGQARLHRTRLERWEEVPACYACANQAPGHQHPPHPMWTS
jgi:hypothetical protein